MHAHAFSRLVSAQSSALTGGCEPVYPAALLQVVQDHWYTLIACLQGSYGTPHPPVLYSANSVSLSSQHGNRTTATLRLLKVTHRPDGS